MLHQFIRNFIPQPVRRSIKRVFHQQFKRSIEWEYMPQGWQAQESDEDIKGWNVTDICEQYKQKWPAFVKLTEEPLPLGIAHESDMSTNSDIGFHNTIMSYAYVLTLVSRQKTYLSMLDWGGGIGHYYHLSKVLVPDLQIEYHCKDMSTFVKFGKELFPDASFYTDETCLNRQYDFVLASSSLQYAQDWQATLRGLAQATNSFLFITRIPVVTHVDSFVFVQRPYFHGYNTEYLAWCLNRSSLLGYASQIGLHLVREFVTGEKPYIDRAPEQNDYRGFLFRRSL